METTTTRPLLTERWTSLRGWLNTNRELFMDVFRIYLGLALFVRGLYFVSHTMQVHETLGYGGITMGQALLAHIVPSIHIVGGLMMAIGLFTRFAALIQIPILLGAVFIIHWREGLFTAAPNLELAGLVLIGLIVVAGYGSGRLSADQWLFTHREFSTENDLQHRTIRTSTGSKIIAG